MNNKEAIHKLEYMRNAYQKLIDEKVDEGRLVGPDITGTWKADTPLNDAYKEHIEALDLAITALEQQEQDRWIPVAEKLPKDFESVLACAEVGISGYGYTQTKVRGCTIGFQLDGNWQFNGYGSDGTRCIAWMPLPEPYQEDKE